MSNTKDNKMSGLKLLINILNARIQYLIEENKKLKDNNEVLLKLLDKR